MIAFFQNQFVSPSEAHVSITDRGYLLGEGVFATMRGYDGACFRPDRHLAMLARGAEAFGLALPISIDRIAAIADEAAVRTGAHDAYVRVTLAAGTGDAPAVLSVLARPFEIPSDEDYANGIAVTTIRARRIPPACVDPSIKTMSYAPSVLARREATSRSSSEGIQLALDGALACATMANLFLIDGRTLLTPSLTSGCRPGTTREAILELADAEGLDAREARIDPDALVHAEEAFLTSVRVECLPINSVDGRTVARSSASRYPRTSALRSALRRLIDAETAPRRRGTP